MNRAVATFLTATTALALAALPAMAQGPFAAHQGLRIFTAFTNSFGPDAESEVEFTSVSPADVSMAYSSSRGTIAHRTVSMADHAHAHVLVLGFSPKMPKTIAGTTSLGLSTAALDELRSHGKTPLAIVYNTSMARLPGMLHVVQAGGHMSVLVGGHIIEASVLHAQGVFGKGSHNGQGDFYILEERDNPLILQYTLHFSWEKHPRAERVVLVEAGNSQQAAMEHTLNTVRKLDIYGIRFAFDKATILPDAASVLADVGKTLKLNPKWTLLIRGHTDSIGAPAHNLKLSQARADSVKAYLVAKFDIDPHRLTAQGVGMSEPKASNATLEGRKINRRVELVRTDR